MHIDGHRYPCEDAVRALTAEKEGGNLQIALVALSCSTGHAQTRATIAHPSTICHHQTYKKMKIVLSD